MKFNIKKITSVIASAVMLSSTVGFAAAANFPAPYVNNGVSDSVLVYGSQVDLSAANSLVSALGGTTTQTTTDTSTTTTGDSYKLSTNGSPLLLNSTLNSVRTIISDSALPNVLADGTFETSSNVDYTQRIILGSNPRIEFKKQPTSSDDPKLGFSLSTTPSSGYIYNATVSFDSNVNFTSSDSVGEELTLFGQKYTVSGSTSSTKLVLLKSSKKIDLSSENELSTTVTVDGETYKVELISADSSSANVKVTDSSGNSNSKTVSSSSKTIQGLEISRTSSYSMYTGYGATLVVGANKITLQDNSAVEYGSDDTTIDGTLVHFYKTDGTSGTPEALGKIVIQVAASSSDDDAFFPGNDFIDPVFKSFKLAFKDITIPVSDTTNREDIKIASSGNDEMTVSFQSHDGSEAKTITWVYNKSDSVSGGMDLADSSGNPIVVVEKGLVNKSGYVVLASDDEGGLYEVSSVYNASSGWSDDYVKLKNVFTGDEKTFKATSEGTIEGITLQDKTYTITYSGASTASEESRQIRVDFDESNGNNVIVYPTITTSKGAKIAFYEPTQIDLSNWDGSNNNASGLMFQNGDGYTTVTTSTTDGDNWSIGGTTINTTLGGSKTVSVGELTYNITFSGSPTATIYLVSPKGGNIVRPALVLIEEKDEASNYNAIITTLDSGYDGDNAGIGVSDVIRTWGDDSVNDQQKLNSDKNLYQEMDIYGSLITMDKSDSDQTTATISYPDEQITANVYIAESSVVISSGNSGTLILPVKDTEIESNDAAKAKNLIVVGGSCINQVAAKILFDDKTPVCGSDFTTKTGVASGQYLIETVQSPYNENKVALLVAGYTADDTKTGITAVADMITKKESSTIAKTISPSSVMTGADSGTTA